MTDRFYEELLRNMAETSVGASTVRGRAAGTVQAVRDFLKTVDLKLVCQCTTDNDFHSHLDKLTINLQNKLPGKECGIARKCLNIFLRGVFYDRYLYERFGLQHLEPWLEIPLDNHVANELSARSTKCGLEKPTSFPGIIGVTPEINEEYQKLANQLLENDTECKEFKSRVHLDLLFWRGTLAQG